jgi:hypothetical protein
MSQRSDYFSLAAVILVIGTSITAINSTFYAAAEAQNKPFSFWNSGGMYFAYVLLILAVALVWFGLNDRPFPPWKKMKFPNIEIEITGLQQVVAPETGSVWRAYMLRVTNHERSQTASLSISYRGKIAAGEMTGAHPRGENWGETVFIRPKGDPPDGFPITNWLSIPFNVRPQHSDGGLYVAMLEKSWWDALSVPREDSLLIEDYVSGKAVFIPGSTTGGPFTSQTWEIPHKDAGDYWTIYPAEPVAAEPSEPDTEIPSEEAT